MFINSKQNVDGMLGFVEQYDFSRANLNQENRILVITTVASICYNNPKGIGSESLFNRLEAESKGLPSSSFEFVPVLLDPRKEPDQMILGRTDSNVRKFGEWVVGINDSGMSQKYLLTNYRALFYDYEERIAPFVPEEAKEIIEELRTQYLETYNTPHECDIIKEHFKVFKYKVDLNTRSQMVRHRINWQELSRRYVSGDRVPFDFFISEPMSKIELDAGYRNEDGKSVTFDMEELCSLCVDFYNKAIDSGIKPQEARRIIPQAMYSTIWGAFQPKQLANFYSHRLDSTAQKEIRLVAETMQELSA